MKRLLPILLPAGLLALVAGPLFGQGKVKVTGVTKSGSNLTFTLQNTLAVPSTGTAASFRMEGSPTMALGTWAPAGAGPFTPVAGPPGGASYSTTFTLTAGTKYFYRFLGIAATAGDADGDGLSDAFETAIFPLPTSGTDPALFDSAGDGFSDGEEYAYGTDALSAASKPTFFSTVATVNFIATTSTATEGASPHQVQILFDRNYSGTVRYAINPVNTMGSADPSAAAANGSLTMNSNSAFIPVPIADDAIASGQRAIIIDLKLNRNSYFIGGRVSHIVLLQDNDAWWTGTLIPASGEISSRTFRVKIAHQGAATTAVFGAGVGANPLDPNDGLPVPVVAASTAAPSINLTSISTAIIPVGSWPGTGVVDTATLFHVDSQPLSIPAGSVLNQPLGRRLVLHAQPALNSATHPHSLLPGIRYVGDYTETLTHTGGATLATIPGTFILVRDIPSPLPRLSKLAPLP